MTKKIRVADLPDIDPAEHLKDEGEVAAYLTVVLEENDPALLAAALGDIARARGMTDIARAAGLTREALYRALDPMRSRALIRSAASARLRAYGLSHRRFTRKSA